MNYLILPYICFIIASFAAEFIFAGFQLRMLIGVMTIIISIPVLGPLNTLFLILCDCMGWFKGIFRNPVVVFSECVIIVSVFFSLCCYGSITFILSLGIYIYAYLMLIPFIWGAGKIDEILRNSKPKHYRIENIPHETILCCLVTEFFSGILVLIAFNEPIRFVWVAIWLIACTLSVWALYRNRDKINIHV